MIDNKENKNCIADWGLGFLIEYNNQKILLDTGSSNNFCENAKKLNIDLKDVDYGVLPHAHFGGLHLFNKTKKKYIK